MPYFVAVDHSTSSIVVAIRGTLSFHDALTDLTAVNDPISADGLPRDFTAHRGMLQAANYVLRQLNQSGVLKKAFLQYPQYNLVVTGHSLGAGAAVLLSMILRPTFPKIRCFAFSPPGGLINQAAARYTETFCMSVIIGDDLVSRMSLVTLDSLKSQLVAELEACRHPKVTLIISSDIITIYDNIYSHAPLVCHMQYRIFLRGCWEVIFGASSSSRTQANTHPLLGDTSNFESYVSTPPYHSYCHFFLIL